MQVFLVFICLLFFLPTEISAKETTATINLSVKFREFTCNVTTSEGGNLNFGNVNISKITLDSGPVIETDLILTCRLDATTPEFSETNAVNELVSATLSFKSPNLGISGNPNFIGNVLSAGNGVIIVPFFNNIPIMRGQTFNLKTMTASKYKLKFQLVRANQYVDIKAGHSSAVLNVELVYT